MNQSELTPRRLKTIRENAIDRYINKFWLQNCAQVKIENALGETSLRDMTPDEIDAKVHMLIH
jgi:hypothetical protein